MNVSIQTIHNSQQRYPTVGDWWWEPNGDLTIKVSDLGDWRHTMLVAIHELVEVVLCKEAGITQDKVDAFDIEFENNRQEDDNSEPGDAPDAPYRKQHCFATGVERLVAAELGVDWKDYDLNVAAQ